MDLIVSKREIEGKEVFRIHHVADEQLVGVEAVEKKEDGLFRKILNWNDGGEVEDFMNDLKDIVPVSEFEHTAISHFLDTFPLNAKEELKHYLKGHGRGHKLLDFLSTSIAHYAFIQTDQKQTIGGVAFVQAYTVHLDREGRFRGIDEIKDEHSFNLILSHLAYHLADNERVFFQINQNDYCGIERRGEEIRYLIIITKVDEDGGIAVGSDLNYTHSLKHVDGTFEFTESDDEFTDEEKRAFIIDTLHIFAEKDKGEVTVI